MRSIFFSLMDQQYKEVPEYGCIRHSADKFYLPQGQVRNHETETPRKYNLRKASAIEVN